MKRIGPFELIYDGRGGLPGCCWKLKRSARSQFSLYDLADRLRVRGWQVPAYPMPANRSDLIVQRVLTRFGVSRDLAGLLVDDLQRAVKHLQENHSEHSLTQKQAGAYSHA